MANGRGKDYWLKKIAGFLHDPPYKVFRHKERDLDALRLWFKATQCTTNPYIIPFYLDVNTAIVPLKTLASVLMDDLYADKKDVINRLKTLLNLSANKIKKALEFKKQRDFHRIAASSLKVHGFGFDEKGKIKWGGLLKHPFSGHTVCMDCSLPVIYNDTALINVALCSVSETAYCRRENLNLLFLNLWHKMYTISLLPVDSRVLDNTVWDAATMQSALAGFVDPNNDYKPQVGFLALKLGPVQDFILASRKLRDLWFSSWLVSWLTWEGMKRIAEELGPDVVVFPDLWGQPFVDKWLASKGIGDEPSRSDLMHPTFPNTFLAIVGLDEPQIGERVENCIADAWKELANFVKSDFANSLSRVKEIYCKLIEDRGSVCDGKFDESAIMGQFTEQTCRLPFSVRWVFLKWPVDKKVEEVIKAYEKSFSPPADWEFKILLEKIKQHKKNINLNLGDVYSLLWDTTAKLLESEKHKLAPEPVYEPGEKCTLCGRRAALKPYEGANHAELRAFWKAMSRVFGASQIKENEMLCGVCLVKRLGSEFFQGKYWNKSLRFPSTASIALAPVIQTLQKKRKLNIFAPINGPLNGREIDIEVMEFFEGTLVPHLQSQIPVWRLEPEWLYSDSWEREVEPLQDSQDVYQRNLYNKINNKHQSLANRIQGLPKTLENALKSAGYSSTLPTYYALIVGDGDDMGRWLRGELAPKIGEILHPEFVKEIYNDPNDAQFFSQIKNLKRPVNPALHKAISSAQRDFSVRILPRVVEKNLGVVIYAGGDDFTAALPTNTALGVAFALRRLWSGDGYQDDEFVASAGFVKSKGEIYRVMGPRATMSMGLVFAHYLEPLDLVLSRARKALKRAKKEGKNRIGIVAVARSGQIKEVVLPWEAVPHLDALAKAMRAGDISDSFVRKITPETLGFDKEAFEADVMRWAGRSLSKKEEAYPLIHVRELLRLLEPSQFLAAAEIAAFLAREQVSWCERKKEEKNA